MSSESTVRRGVLRTLWSRKWLIVVPAVIGAGSAAIVSASWPAKYVSAATIMVVPPRVGSDYVRPAVTIPIDERLETIRLVVLSRTRLERVVNEFNLYADERKTGIMEEIIDQFRKDVDVQILDSQDARSGTTFRLSFVGSNPRTVMKVTEKLANLFVDESLSDRKVMTEGTGAFLESQIEDVKKRLTEHEAKLAAYGRKPTEAMTIEFDVLRETYRSLLLKRTDVRIATNLEARSIGETFRPLDVASFPERPIGPSRLQVNLMGAGAGLVMGLVLVAALPRRQRAS